MMIATQDVVSTALCFVGRPLTPQESAVLSQLAEAALAVWCARLRPELSQEDCRGPLITAAAWSALAGFTHAARLADPAPSFTAGEVSVHHSSGDATACTESLFAQAEELMRPYTQDPGFAFREVEA